MLKTIEQLQIYSAAKTGNHLNDHCTALCAGTDLTEALDLSLDNNK
jgi:hypothetical protein